MGTAASSTTRVQRISIDKNGDTFKSNGRLSSAGGRSVSSIIGGRLRSASSLGSKSSIDKDRRLANLHSQLEGTEKRLADSEDLVKSLQRDLCSMEMKNCELADEITWLKGQIGTLPETGPTALCSGNLYKTEQQVRQNLTDKYKATSEELDNMKEKYHKEKDCYENMVKNLQNELKQQLERFQKKLKFEEGMNEKFEEIVRKELGEAYLYNFKNSFARDTPALIYSDAKPMCRNFLPSGGRLSTPQLLNGHTDMPSTPPHPPSTASSTHSSRIFTSATARRLSVESPINEEIDEMLKSSAVEIEPPLLPRTASDTRKKSDALPKYADNIRQVKPTKLISTNIYTLSENMEPVKLLDNNPIPFSNRPATADTVTRADLMKIQNSNSDKRESSPLNRGSSVPMLFRPSKSRENRRKGSQKSTSIEPTAYDIENFENDEDNGDDEIDDILNESIPSLNSFSRGRISSGKIKDRDSLSAKSRDSGYLGENTIANHIGDVDEM